MASDLLTTLPATLQALITAHTTSSPIPFRARTAYTHRTWARTFSSLPELYIQPHTPAEVQLAITLARQCRRRLVVVGSGHSPSDLTCTSSWMLNLDRLNRVLAIDQATGLATVEAGIRVYALSAALEQAGLALPSLGSIDEQSIAGAIATGTHGSSLRHGLVSETIVSLKITLADGQTHTCSAEERPDLFRAALLSVGALGVVTEVTLQAVPAFSLAWSQTIDADARLYEGWDGLLWTQAEFVRVWWFPYMRRAVVWTADKVSREDITAGRAPGHYHPRTSFQDSTLGYVVYQNLLALSRWFPRITPWIEWFVFGLNYGFSNGESTRVSGCQESHKAFLLNCLYSQFVNEWAIPLSKGPEALQRLGAWLNRLQPGDAGYVDHGIPFSAEGLWVHSPVEVRVSNTNVRTSAAAQNRPFLDITPDDEPALYLNATMYRAYHRDPAHHATERYYEAFEWLMRDLGGKPHWAKTFSVTPGEFADWYGEDWAQFCRVREEVDPEGLFVGPWHRRYLLGGGQQQPAADEKEYDVLGASGVLLPLEEVGFVHEKAADGGLRVSGHQNPAVPQLNVEVWE
ncbi:D-arabinono-1,4-lactone oxidase-domain-containing protein [Dichotomopilus funicola]|uniref:D-arabinono-1,4-lactone oxidase n=1 Tax=Dichotomopilus funicola TaxID=1934379 RepID=A0AAN6UYI9_9PEZI|nr:D-arabinono-1,4-lactone oxidase-domain-containing protein [Dichotomopilus funicola]